MRAAAALLLLLAAACRRTPAPAPDDAFAAYILATHVRSAAAPSAPAPSVERAKALGFVFADDRGCGTPAEDAGYCAAAGPKPWSEAELRETSAALERLRAAGLGRFLERVRRNGFDTFLRTSSVAHREPGGGWRRLPYPNSLAADRRFLIADARFREGERPLLHLLAHGYDFGREGPRGFAPALSHAPEFLRLTGFRLDGGGRWELSWMTPARRKEYLELFARTNAELLAAKDEARLREIRARAEAFVRDARVPSFHSLIDPYEALAEWTVLVHAEPARARALNPELAEWIRTNVLEAPDRPFEP